MLCWGACSCNEFAGEVRRRVKFELFRSLQLCVTHTTRKKPCLYVFVVLCCVCFVLVCVGSFCVGIALSNTCFLALLCAWWWCSDRRILMCKLRSCLVSKGVVVLCIPALASFLLAADTATSLALSSTHTTRVDGWSAHCAFQLAAAPFCD